MFYTNNSIRLVSRMYDYLQLIQKANNRYEEKRSLLARYDSSTNKFDVIKLFNDRDKIVEFMERWSKLSKWLVWRYQNVMTELGNENLTQVRKLVKENDLHLSSNEVKIIDL